MKKKLNIRFIGCGNSIPVDKMMFYPLISEKYEISMVGKPDYILDLGMDMFRHYDYDDCIKIFYGGENIVPDFNAYDYAVGFDHLNFGDRYLRSPLFARSTRYKTYVERKSFMTDDQLLNRGFCSFVVSNVDFGDPIRRIFFERLSKYKPVASGGRFMNNVGGAVADKIAFCRGYKFNIAFENSESPGYTTEKILDAYLAETVPIYFGNPTIETDFRPQSMVRVRTVLDVEAAIDEIIRLDNDDDAYLEKCREVAIAPEDPLIYENELKDFFSSIFEQPKEAAFRRIKYGCQPMMQRHLKKVLTVDRWLCNLRSSLTFLR